MKTLILGSTKHVRFQPKKHDFSYPLYMLQLDIKKLSTFNDGLFTGYNKRRLLSVWDEDYLHDTPKSIEEKLKQVIQTFKDHEEISQIYMVSIPRLMLKTFRPVGFYLCYDKHKQMKGMIAEVTNTYKEASFYKVEECQSAQRVTVDKHFHVSPFFNEEGTYTFKVLDTDQRFEVHIDYVINEQKVFYANFVGKKTNLTRFHVVKLLLTHPFTTFLVYPRILFEALRLYSFKKLEAYSKPKLTSQQVLRPMPLNWIEKIIVNKIKKLNPLIEKGHAEIKLTNGDTITLGKEEAIPRAKIHIRHNWFFRSVQKGGEIGFGESYMKGEWESPNLTDVIVFMIHNLVPIEKQFMSKPLRRMMDLLGHRLRKNSIKKSKENISEHYDLGNKFYQLFLDSTMMYSSGVFLKKTDSLQDAQEQKVNYLCQGLELKKDQHVLEIGSGWGYVAAYIAKTYGCKVTTVTLSEKQKEYAEQVVKEQGVGDKVDIKLQDYRNVQGEYDAIISIEMIEAVGKEYLETYVKTCDKCLKEGGYFALQTITYPDALYDNYCKETDFIKKHIFPGGHLPSLERMQLLIEKQTNLQMRKSQNIAQSYAKTLAMWRQAFESKKELILTMGFSEEFYRKWVYYFAYCEGAFQTDYLGCYQLHYQKKIKTS
ncbi:MAG: DUF1365 family protein [bacterium]